MSADGAPLDLAALRAPAPEPAPPPAPPPAPSAALFLRDPARRRLLWANARGLALLGARDPAALAPEVAAALDAALEAARGETAHLPCAAGIVSGRIARSAVALPDGRIGERVAFEPDAPPPRPERPQRRRETLIEASALARLAHEFRSPLTAVLGFAEFLREAIDELPPERARAYLDDLATAAERMRRLADDLVALGADGAGLTVAPTDLDALAAEAVRLAAPAARAVGARIAPAGRTGLTALADPDALARALGNLLDNALRHAAATGEVRLSVRDMGRDVGARITVADDGPGLAPDQLAEALRPYGRGGGGTGAGAAGGLGLPIVAEIMAAHGGALEIDTAPGAGLRAHLVLPPARVLRGAGPRR
ncbi:MAG: HAMP domain-containing sensor histidine kinase [Rubrimonas sp.]|uniref:sensor histidine kinase n=1 Tax=Rubrimonas sp. TaxID=2036015 RepID=UPI002FDDB2CC